MFDSQTKPVGMGAVAAVVCYILCIDISISLPTVSGVASTKKTKKKTLEAENKRDPIVSVAFPLVIMKTNLPMILYDSY